jgi:hypothetical protein
MKPLISTLLLFAVVSPVSYAQTPASVTQTSVDKCSLGVAESPQVRGLKLGQKSEVLRRLFNEEDSRLGRLIDSAQRSTDDLGRQTVQIYNSMYRNSEKLKNLTSVNLTYLDDRLASIKLYFDESVRWQSSQHFAAAVADQLQLPTKGWSDPVMPRLTCTGFFVQVFVFDSRKTSMLLIEEANLELEIQKRKAKKEQKRGADSQP